MVLLVTIMGGWVFLTVFGGAAPVEAAPLKLRGICYGPFRDGQAPWGDYPMKDQIRQDLQVLKGVTYSIIAYSSKGIFGEIPKNLLSSSPPLVEIRSVIRGGAIDWSKNPLTGYAYGADPANQRVVLYARTNLWYIQPFTSTPYTKIAANGKWKNKTHLGEEYVALFVNKSFEPNDIEEDLPGADGDLVLAIARRLSLENLPAPLPCLLGGK
jgi:hypothetical protein